MLTRRLALLTTLAFGLAGRTEAFAQDRTVFRGLVVSASYRGTPYFLANTSNDGVLITACLEDLRFSSVDRIIDPDVASLGAGIRTYLGKLSRSDVAFVYIAGHGVQISGRNYLLMNDGRSVVDLAEMIEALRRASDTVVILLDACRNNPFERAPVETGALRAARDIVPRLTANGSVDLEFVSIDLSELGSARRVGQFELTGSGIAIMYATDPRNTAADYVSPTDTNSPFALAVNRRVRRRRPLPSIMSDISNDVVRATGGRQSPWFVTSITTQIFLAGDSRTIVPHIP